MKQSSKPSGSTPGKLGGKVNREEGQYGEEMQQCLHTCVPEERLFGHLSDMEPQQNI